MNRVAVTTDRIEEVAPVFSSVGLEPVHLPCIRVVPEDEPVLRAARKATSTAELVVITSSRTVELLWPDGTMPAVDVAAVGRVTADAVSAAGGRVVALGRSGLAALGEAVEPLGAGRVVLVHGAGADPGGMARLRAVAPLLDEHVVYRVSPLAPDLAPVEAVVFASPSAVQGWALSRSFDDLISAAIGQTTAAAVARYRGPDLVATRPSFPVLAHELSAYMEVRV